MRNKLNISTSTPTGISSKTATPELTAKVAEQGSGIKSVAITQELLAASTEEQATAEALATQIVEEQVTTETTVIDMTASGFPPQATLFRTAPELPLGPD